MKGVSPPFPSLYRDLVRGELQQDLGRAGDLTSDALLDLATRAGGEIVSRAPGRLCGVTVAVEAFQQLDPELVATVPGGDGADVEAGTVVLALRGRARALLAAERTALDFLGHLSGVATATRELVRAVEGFPARIVCTRKTTPGLRTLEKYAVRVGGGSNHRFGLDDGVLIKDNHLALVGSIREAVERARARVGHMVKIEVEVETLEQVEEALAAGAEALLLDNMPPSMLEEAVRLCRGRAISEASGRIRLETAAEVAASGVDLISVGWITHSAPTLDLSLEVRGGE